VQSRNNGAVEFHFHIRALLNLRNLACRKNRSNTVRVKIISLVLSTGSMPCITERQ
jgi:hypothetical protein